MTLRTRLRRFFRTDRAAATAEFVIGFPLVFLMFIVTLETCFLMMRATMLQRGLEMAIRDVRLGNIKNPLMSVMEQAVCDRIQIVPNCTSSLTLEFTLVNQASFQMPAPTQPCTVRSAADAQARSASIYSTGAANDLLVVRACLVVNAISPISDVYRLYSRTALVIEPDD